MGNNRIRVVEITPESTPCPCPWCEAYRHDPARQCTCSLGVVCLACREWATRNIGESSMLLRSGVALDIVTQGNDHSRRENITIHCDRVECQLTVTLTLHGYRTRRGHKTPILCRDCYRAFRLAYLRKYIQAKRGRKAL